jgi:hypothetical protein
MALLIWLMRWSVSAAAEIFIRVALSFKGAKYFESVEEKGFVSTSIPVLHARSCPR